MGKEGEGHMQRTEWTDGGKPILTAQLPLGSFFLRFGRRLGKARSENRVVRILKGSARSSVRSFEKAEWSVEA